MGVSRAYIAPTPYNGVELSEVDYEQTADTMYMAHIDHEPWKLVRYGHTDWRFIKVTFSPVLAAPGSTTIVPTQPNVDSENDGDNFFPQPVSYCVTAVNEDTGEESRASGIQTATVDLSLKRNYVTFGWAAVSGADRYNVYKADNSQFFGYIGTTDKLTFRDDNIGPALDRAPPEAYNPFPGAGDYPSTVALFEQRAMWARSYNTPNGIWATRSALLENMDRSQPLREDDSIAFSIVAGRVNSINQLVSTTGLLALTSDSIFTVDGDGQGGILTGNSPPSVKRQIGRGASRLGALVIDNVVFYAPSVGSSVRTIQYSFEYDGQKSNDVSIFSPHLFEGFSIKAWCYAQEPRSMIWAVRSDGALLCFTWEQDQNVWGWTICETDGSFVDCISISEGGENRVYFLVDRIVGGVTRRFVERMAPQLWDDVASSVYLDCAISASFDEPQSTFSGLWHLEGRTVSGLVDGVVVHGLAVTNGHVTLPPNKPTAKRVTFGLPYTSDIDLLPIRANLPDGGNNTGRRQQTGDVCLILRDSRSVYAGIDAEHLFLIKSRTSEAYGAPDDLMNGDDYVLSTDGKAWNEVTCWIRSVDPLPMTVLGVTRDMVIGG
ncbi:hypothetical protein [Novosphingobium sp. Leaf2]|uniref:hypothetical protein n=1 Tax=Novosphingobium sp. Leaf2 TaxID=1735670 RepID=UPI0006FB06D7|nr:hypothetical protein [Novosphingobium sp. Leaf2]KQM18380.1 hypothetical protein ASE49_09220 [Novosphingobium sp. Leaf2]